MGIISGAWNANAERTDAFQKDPNWYTFGDWITLGLVGTADRALNPDEPLSLQHWPDTFFVMSSIYNGYTAVKKNISLNNQIKQFEASAKTHDMLGESYGVEGGSGALKVTGGLPQDISEGLLVEVHNLLGKELEISVMIL